MASSLALKRLVSSNLVSRSLRPAGALAQPASSRLFNTNAVREYDSDDRDVDVDRRADRRIFSPFSDILGPFSGPFPASGSLSQLLNMMDQFMESPVTSNIRRNWDARETAEGLHLRMDMPGLSREDVKVSVEQNTLKIKGEGKKEFDDDDGGRRFTSRIDLPEKLYKTNEIKAEMKNGVLKVFVPKIKEEERADVFQVNVE
ncbi:Molecular chaperone (small heat-shock protein Hsp26/Hsp42) [Handroanthus impetiginosus]|uniref:Molecular chaperone (Small heat-shock protein Hsp26/Hsp42) n=1 Tax=Handroanthus impetiginosus TaxID=429701 RepID=A0A2G9HWX0_9LAMI|nr:Molecular chaperone (small heat-shock protein Hsp26/Hsp42) [Handroanthus impetiginosus]